MGGMTGRSEEKCGMGGGMGVAKLKTKVVEGKMMGTKK